MRSCDLVAKVGTTEEGGFNIFKRTLERKREDIMCIPVRNTFSELVKQGLD